MPSLLDRKRAIDAAKAQKLADEKRKRKEAEKRRHLLLKKGASRDVRDAYFLGLVFAAFANDEKMDSTEERVIRDIGCSLEMTTADVDEAIETLRVFGNDDAGVEKKLALIEECVKALGNKTYVSLFVDDFEKVWNSGSGKPTDLCAFKGDFARWTNVCNARKSVRRTVVIKHARKKKIVVDDGMNSFDSFEELLDVMAVRCAAATEISDETFEMFHDAIQPYSQWPVNWKSAIRSVVDDLARGRLDPHGATIRIYCAILLRGLKMSDEIWASDPLLRVVEGWLKRDWSGMEFLSLLQNFIQEHFE